MSGSRSRCLATITIPFRLPGEQDLLHGCRVYVRAAHRRRRCGLREAAKRHAGRPCGQGRVHKAGRGGRNKAVELAAKSDQQSRTNLRQCEDKIKATLAVAPASPATPAPAAAMVEKKMEKPAAAAKVALRAATHKPAAHPARRTALAEPAAAPKPADVPSIPKKKKVDNDPLAGIGKP